MPTLQLPKDDRWGQLGAGIGGVLNSVMQAYQEKQLQDGVAAIQADNALPNEKKPTEIFKKFGNKGIEALAKMNQLEEQRSVITRNLAGAGLQEIERKIKEQQLPLEQRLRESQIAHTQAQTTQLGAQTAETQAQTSRIQQLTGPEVRGTEARASASEAQAGLTAAETGKVTVETQQKKLQLDAAKAAMAEGSATLDTTLDTLGIPAGPQREGVKEIYRAAARRGEDGWKAIAPYIEKIQQRQEVKPTPQPEQKFARDAIEHATSALRFMDTFVKGGASKLGFFSGANAKVWLEKVGLSTGDVETVDMWNAAQQQVASTATTGGGFFSAGRVKLAHDVTGGITETPLHALLATDQVADRMIEKLTNTLKGYEGTSTNVKPIQGALDKWKSVKAITGTFTSDVIPDPRRPDDPAQGRTVAFFNNAQIDPKTFSALVKNDNTQYTLGRGKETVPGAKLFELARARNVDPFYLLEQLRGQR